MAELQAGVARELGTLGRRFELDRATLGRLDRLLAALAREPDPPTTDRAPSRAVQAHVADSLSALELPRLRAAERIADIGSGAGFPGVPLAVVLGAATVDLIESSARKCETIARLATAAAAANARPVPERVESWAAGPGAEAYQLVTARAVAELAVLVEYAAPLLTVGGALVAWKGRRDRDEEHAGRIAATRLGLEYEEIRPVTPFEGARHRHLHAIVKREPTPPDFPRRPGRAVKRPLS